LVIRIGVTGAVHVYHDHLDMDKGKQLYFDPIGRCSDDGEADAFYRDTSQQGRVLGSNSVFCGNILASILYRVLREKNLSLHGAPITAQYIGEGIKRAIQDVQVLYREGYGTVKTAGKEKGPQWGFDYEPSSPADPDGEVTPDRLRLKYSPRNLICKPDEDGSENSKLIGCANILQTPRWSLLQEAAGTALYRLACKIAAHGLQKALNFQDHYCDSELTSDAIKVKRQWGPIIAPVVRFDKLVSVEREEIENLRNIDAILRAYHGDPNPQRPLSLAVFGPPGSGKSTGVKSVATGVFGKDIHFLTCNLANFSDPRDLAVMLLQTAESIDADKRTIKKKVPLLFVDEFDCSLGKEPLGWLRYFLALMEDGEYKHGEQLLHLPMKTILVFGGGTFQSFEDFAGQSAAYSPEKRLEFTRAKGPDFVSRLVGHINMIGINPRDGNDKGYLIRRAIQLRYQLESSGLVGASKTAMVVPALLEAMLRVPQYKHGSRSLRIVLNTCVGADGRTSLPTLPQLEMHVAAEQLIESYENALRYPTIRQTQRDGLIVDYRRR
jgi:hypothetical protein